MMKEVLWGETEENGGEGSPLMLHLLLLIILSQKGEKVDRSRSPLMLDEKRQGASERPRLELRRNSDEEMESDEEEEVEELDRDESDVLASIINTAVKSDGFFRHQQVIIIWRTQRIDIKVP